MGFELQHELINCYEPVLDTTIFQEETQESIVPDACPDILRIVDSRAYVCLTGKQIRDNLVTVTGLIRTSVFYLPEGETAMRHLEITTPFTAQADDTAISAQGTVQAFPAVRWAEARALNPRKILLRLDIAVAIRVFQPNQLKLCCAAVAEENHGVHQLQCSEMMDMTSAVQEKPFTFSDTIDLGVTDRSHAEVLSIHGTPCCSESRIIGSKLIFKGHVELEALVLNGAELKSVRQSMPFSQIMEIPGAGDNCSCEVRISMSDLSFQPDDSFSNSGMLTLELLAQAVVWENRCVTLLGDLYSTAFEMETQLQKHTIHRFLEQTVKTTPVRELLETTTMVRAISHVWADLGEVRSAREDGQTTVSAQVQLNAVYLDDAEQLQSVHKTITVCCALDCPVECVCRFWCAPPVELFGTPAVGGIEVRFSVDFHCMVSQNRQISAVASASLGSERPKGDASQPSIILRLAAPGERLWDIAKHYGSTEEEILQANELESGNPPSGKMLLIPQRR